MRMTAVICLSLIVSGCAGSSSSPSFVWLRSDGQRVTNPQFVQRFDIDRAACMGEMQKANLSATTDNDGAVPDFMKGCLAQRGYVMVRAEEADGEAARLTAAARR